MAAMVVVLTLPFVTAFTLNIGFPLKIYEIAIILWVIGCVVKFRIDTFDEAILLKGMIFVLYIFFALIFNIFVLDNVGLYGYVARISPFVDGLMKGGYALLCVAGFNLVAYATYRSPALVIRLWLIGATISAVVQFLFFGISALGLPVPQLPGMPDSPTGQQYIVVLGAAIFRAGTFLEGNMSGPFFILSFLLANFSGRRRLSVMFLAAAVVTFSTTALIGFAMAVAYILVSIKKNVMPAFFIVLSVLFFVNTPLFDFVVYDKFAGTGDYNSINDRTQSLNQAFDMFVDNPVLGVGISQYGFHMHAERMWLLNFNSSQSGSAAREEFKVIPNNVYVELLSELGLMGIGCFLLYFSNILLLAWKCPNPIIKAGILSVLTFWLASPTFTLMYYWVYLAVVCGLAKIAVRQTQAQRLWDHRQRFVAAMGGRRRRSRVAAAP